MSAGGLEDRSLDWWKARASLVEDEAARRDGQVQELRRELAETRRTVVKFAEQIEILQSKLTWHRQWYMAALKQRRAARKRAQRKAEGK